MKRFLAVLCTLCLLVAVCPAVPAESAHTYNFEQLQGCYKTQGRAEVVSGALNMDTSSSGFEFYFNGSGNVTMGADVWCTYTNNLFLSVVVDGTVHRMEVYTGTTTNAVYKEITLVENLAQGYHHIEVYKQTEASSGLVTVWGVTFTGTPVTAPPADKLVMEVVGDSISGGASNLATNDTTNAGYPVYQDGTQTYAYFTGEALGADVRVTQTSGYGCCGGWNAQGLDLNLQDMFPYTSYWRDHSEAGLYGFDPPADIVVINLGTNDSSAARAGRISLTNAEFKAGAKNLMTMAREKNPNAKIVWVTGMMGVTYQTELTAAVAELGGAEDGYFFTVLPEGTSGGEGHPDVAQHQAAAEVLTAFLLENCLPSDYMTSFTDRETLKAAIANAKTVSAPSDALTEAIAMAEMELACNTTDAYRLGARKAALETAGSMAVGLSLMPVKGVTQSPYSNEIHFVWQEYHDSGIVDLYKGGEGRYWPYVHTEYERMVDLDLTPYLTVEAATSAEWNIDIAYLDKDGERRTLTASQAYGNGGADFAANITRTVYEIDFGGYVKSLGHTDENGCITVVGCDIYVVGTTDTIVQLHSCALTSKQATVQTPTAISGAYAVTDGVLACLPANTTASELLAVMDNAAYLQIVDANGAAAGETLATGMTLQLVVDGAVVDEAAIVVCGDVNGDGLVNTVDAREMLAMTLQGGSSVDVVFSLAMDIDGNGLINTADIRTLLKGFVA